MDGECLSKHRVNRSILRKQTMTVQFRALPDIMRKTDKPQGKAVATKSKTATKAPVQRTKGPAKKGNKSRKCPASDRSDEEGTAGEEVEEPCAQSKKKARYVRKAEEVLEELEVDEEEDVTVEDNDNTDTEQVSL